MIFGKFQTCKNSSIAKFGASEILKTSVLEILKPQKLISRKIWAELSSAFEFETSFETWILTKFRLTFLESSVTDFTKFSSQTRNQAVLRSIFFKKQLFLHFFRQSNTHTKMPTADSPSCLLLTAVVYWTVC